MWLTHNKLFELFRPAPVGLAYGNTAIGLYLGLTDTAAVPEIVHLTVNKLKESGSDYSIENGAPGVVPVLDIIAHRLTNSHVTELIKESDAIVFRSIAYDCSKISVPTCCNAILYICYRMKCTKLLSMDIKLWSSLLYKLLHILTEQYISIITTDHRFSLRYEPAFCLLCILSCVQVGLNPCICKKKVLQLIPCIIEHFPVSAANRFYYCMVTTYLRKCLAIESPALDAYINTIQNSYNLESIFASVGNNIYLEHGLPGLYLMFHFSSLQKSQLHTIAQMIKEKIRQSAEMARLIGNDSYLKNHIGLFDGIGGIELISLLMRLDQIKHGR